MKTVKALVLVAAAEAMSIAGAREIDPSTYVLLPIVTLGEREIDLRFGSGSTGQHILPERDAGIGFGLGVSEHWFTEIAGQVRQASGSGVGFDSLEWENIVQVSEQGEWPVDLGVAVEVDRPRDPSLGTTVNLGPLLQKDIGRFQVNLNFLASHKFQAAQFPGVHWAYQFQAKYRYAPALEYGFQAFGSPGSTSRARVSFEDQTHRFGPMVLGKFRLSDGRGLQYNAAFLLGATNRSPERTLRFQLEYEF
jgi:hypothetical protein